MSLQKSGSEIIYIVSSDRRQREDWVVCVVYVFREKWKYHDGLIIIVICESLEKLVEVRF